MANSLFSPLTLRSVVLPNRIAMSPMCQYMALDGVASAWHMAHLGARAIGGTGLITVEATAVEPAGRLTLGCVGLWNDAQADALRPVTDFIRSQGSVSAVQLAHSGRKGARTRPWEEGGRALRSDEGGWELLAPSAIPFGDYAMPREMNAEDLEAVEAAFANAARLALRAGFDAINLHFAHGYLLHSFLSPLTNQRGDEYGGSLENRARFPRRIVRAVRSAWPDHLPIIVRLSCSDWADGGFEIDEAITVARWFAEDGADLIDCSSSGLVDWEKVTTGLNYQVEFARRIGAETGLPTGAVGMIVDPAQAENIISSGDAALVFLGRALLDDPNWAHHAADTLSTQNSWPLPYRRAVGRLKNIRALLPAEGH
ncbi:NADH:flavin oxidoreductase/NADH oxidase [Aquamicrobium zhengzhouense]|uniref:NADH:flavin oxidoreductase/NADH oxidase n=1 Tax=Aquamicrobium zhengzhouense TaxID=2781738 RepID=UPI0018E1AC46|nr:NADH:flavin oxidoreductase/NADH oxidase [Aquamicrobium zhengzhouense]